MALINYLVVMATVLLAAVLADTSCQGEDWKSETLEQRASEPKWVAFVQVVSEQMSINGSATDFEVMVNVSCWLKKGAESEDDGDGAPQTGDAPATGDAPSDDNDEGGYDGNMTVPEAGQNITIFLEQVHCKSQTLEKGKKYVLFMEKHMKMFQIVNVNDEPGALTNLSNDDFEALYRGIDTGMTGKPDGECVDGVEIACFVGDYNKKVCDGAASLVATMAIIVAAILAIVIF